jgi:hypothetical protein
MKLGIQGFLNFLRRMVDQGFLRETEIGYEPFDIEFKTSAHVQVRVRRKIKALELEKIHKRTTMYKYYHLPMVRRKSFR